MPICQQCNIGTLVPLSDYGAQGAAVHYKAWTCTNPGCGYNIKIRNGDIFVNEPIRNGSPLTLLDCGRNTASASSNRPADDP